MHPYGAQALRHWQTHLPDRYAEIEDPQTFFDELGEQIAQLVQDRAAALAGPDPQEESYLDKLGRLNMARATAESEVLREMLPAPQETADSDETT